jgi:hypothetical protein
LITPLYDGWSLDFWVLPQEGPPLLPSRSAHAEQKLELHPDLAVTTQCFGEDTALSSRAFVEMADGQPRLTVDVSGRAASGGWLVASLRPLNPEGVQFIEDASYHPDGSYWLVDKDSRVVMDPAPERVLFSTYMEGDVYHRLNEEGHPSKVECEHGLATSAALFALAPEEDRPVKITVPLGRELKRSFPHAAKSSVSWPAARMDAAQLSVPDQTIQNLYDSAAATLILLSAHQVFPGPYNYRRFWFRDAAIMLNAILTIGLKDRCRRHLDVFPEGQTRKGYFRSQEGEWDSNGQVLWVYDRFRRLTGQALPKKWVKAIVDGAEWIIAKRVRGEKGLHDGLLPPGFSAEHLGPNDYYYWDDYWSLAGLRAASRIARAAHMPREAERYRREAEDLHGAIETSIAGVPEKHAQGGIPASPYRRMDAGAVGSLVADFPLAITDADDPRITATVNFLVDHCFHQNAFFQDMVHSGINAYLTLDVAQTMLRQGDHRYRSLIRAIADKASPTGQWPEAIHPFSGGGCMGDGQHGWAAAEWVMMIRNLFVREEGDGLVLGQGLFPEWLAEGGDIFFGPTLTPHGRVDVRFYQKNGQLRCLSNAVWHTDPPTVEVAVPGYERQTIQVNKPQSLTKVHQ